MRDEDDVVRRNGESSSRDQGRADAWGVGGDRARDDLAPDPTAYDTVILPARVDSEVARRVAIAASRDGVAIADLLGRAAAYDWHVEDDSGERPGR